MVSSKRHASELTIKPPYGQQNQTTGIQCLGKRVQ